MVSDSGTPVRVDRLRALNQPVLVEVATDQQGRPVALIERDPSEPNSERGTSKAVEAVLDSWRIDDEWWRDTISRRYVDITLDGGKHVVLFQDLISGEWFLQQP